jgi:predicted flap endonuclease-1-like 5' DNA nuclease
LKGFVAALKIPVFLVTKRMHDAGEKRRVQAIYDELMATGNVEENLPADDREVRELHRREVLSQRQSSTRTDRPAPEVTTSARPRRTPAPPSAPRDVSSITGRQPAKRLRFYLEPSADVEDAPSIGPKIAKRLAKVGITTVADLLKADAAESAALLKVRYINPDYS